MFQVSTTRPFPDLMAEAMQRMVEQMAKAPAESSGKLDADFVGQMIPHHQGAIDMTRAVALYARKGDRAIRNLITTILTTQPDEIRRMVESIRVPSGSGREDSVASPYSVSR